MATARCAIAVAPTLCSVIFAGRGLSVKQCPIFPIFLAGVTSPLELLDDLTAEQIDGAVDATGRLTGATTLHAV